MSYDPEAFKNDLNQVLKEIREMLIAKNAAYNDSALSPVNFFSNLTARERLFVRIDDKLNRFINGKAEGEDTLQDLLGYFILERIDAKRNKKD